MLLLESHQQFVVCVCQWTAALAAYECTLIAAAESDCDCLFFLAEFTVEDCTGFCCCQQRVQSTCHSSWWCCCCLQRLLLSPLGALWLQLLLLTLLLLPLRLGRIRLMLTFLLLGQQGCLLRNLQLELCWCPWCQEPGRQCCWLQLLLVQQGCLLLPLSKEHC